ncbi:MAG: cation diffusion facilitator family transporter [Candidatus Lokiarchaeota archaeon]|nr:cation diffusion facilitator family transporter [Candidatus Lokiarchaeota archaeon]MBD3200710.1 cation diffusion facilitator family transporter [Candidatus Lokiarchaeota archaeon]
MPLSDIEKDFDKNNIKNRRKSKYQDYKLMKESFPYLKGEPHGNFLYAMLCFIYDGYTNIQRLKEKMKTLFISTTKQLVIEEEDIEEYIQLAKREELVIQKDKNLIELTKKGKKLTEVSYANNLTSSHYLKYFFSERTVMIASTVILIVLSFLKILIGFQLGSQAMLTEGIENLTDLVKIAIIVIIAFKLKKERMASGIIILLMFFTGGTLIWSGIESLLYPNVIIPTVQAFIISILSMILNIGMLFLKGMVGRISGNLALLSDSKDSQLNAMISGGVIIGLIFAIFKFFFVDALVGIVIALFIFKEGIEILREITRSEEEFDISEVQVYGDHIYDNRLTAYILGSIRREELSEEKLIQRFEEGLKFGRQYYKGFADFFYDKLDGATARKHLNKLINDGYIKYMGKSLVFTQKGLKAFYKAKTREYKERMNNVDVGYHFKTQHLYCIVFIVLLIFVILFATEINQFFLSL